MSTAQATTKTAWGQKCWAFFSNTYYARIAAAVFTFLSIWAGFLILFSAHMRESKNDNTTGEAVLLYVMEIMLPAAIYIAITFRICAKPPKSPKANVMAPMGLLALALICIWMIYYSYQLSDGVIDWVKVPISPDNSQLQPIPRALLTGVNELCQYSALFFSFLLGLDVWSQSKK